MSSPVDEGVCVADGGLINPAAFPFRSADLDTSLITGSAGDVVGLGEGVAGAAGDAQSAWRGLQAPGVFESPDGEAVYGLMGPAVSGAAVMSGVTTRVGAALETYAAALDGIKPTLAEFEERAVAFRTEALAGYQVTNLEAYGSFTFTSYWESGAHGQEQLAGTSMDPHAYTTIPWNEHGPAVEKNASLLGELNRIIESVSTAAATCANTIQAELTTVCAVPAQAITAAALDANPDVSSWGRPVEESRNCTESVGHGLGNFWEGTWTGAASLIGRDPESGDWSWGVAGRSWLGVGDFALSTVIITSPLTWLLTCIEGPVGGFVAGRMEVAVTAWGSLIGWDHQAFLAGQDGWNKWRADGVAAGTEVVANIGTFFIPGAGAAAGSAKGVVTGTRIGGFVARTAVRVGEIVVPGGSHLVAGAVRVVDLGAGGVKSGWRALADVVKPVTRPNGLPGVVDTATRNVSLPAHTPVSDAIRLDQPNGPRTVDTPGTRGTGTETPIRVEGETPGVHPDRTDSTTPHGTSDGAQSGSVVMSGHGDAAGGAHSSGEYGGGTSEGGYGHSESVNSDRGHGGDVDANGANTHPEKGTPAWAVGPDDPIPDELAELSGDRVEAVADARAASTEFSTHLDAFNDALRQKELPTVERAQFTAGKLRKAVSDLQDKLADHPYLIDQLDDLVDAANGRRAAIKAQSSVGERFGEVAGEVVAERDGLVSVVAEAQPGTGAVDQAFKTVDGDELVIQEVKGPSAKLGTQQVPGVDGVRVTATQGSEAYLRAILRTDTRLRDAILTDPTLHKGLLDGTTRLRYRLVQPDTAGNVKVTEFVIDQAKLDLQGWLRAP